MLETFGSFSKFHLNNWHDRATTRKTSFSQEMSLLRKGMDLVKAVELLEPGPLDQDQLERLAKVMPDPAQMQQLKLAFLGL